MSPERSNRITIVEEHSRLLDALSRFLTSQYGISPDNISLAKTADEAKDAFNRKDTPKVIIANETIEGHSITEFLSKLKNDDPDPTVIIITTSNLQGRIAEEIRTNFPNSIMIEKPYTSEELAQAIENNLQ